MTVGFDRARKCAAVLVCSIALAASVAVTPIAEAAPSHQVVAAKSCGPLWLRVWLIFTNPAYVGYLQGTGKCGG